MVSSPTRQWQRANVLLFLAATLFVVFEYTFLHEGGHALVGVLSGARVSAFSLRFWTLDAFVGISGTLTPAQTVANNLAGVALPLLAWLAYTLALPRRSTFFLECIRVIGSLVFLSTLLAWIVLPFAYLAGSAPSDDVVNYLTNSGTHPPLVAAVALLGLVGGWALLLAKVGGLSAELRLLRESRVSLAEPATRRALSFVVAAALACGLVAFAANGYSLASVERSYQPPQGYVSVGKVDLSDAAHDRSVLYSFSLDQPAPVGILLVVDEVRSEYLELRLTGPNGYDKVIVHAEGYTARKDTPRIEARLEPGRYEVVLTSKVSPGVVELFAKVGQ